MALLLLLSFLSWSLKKKTKVPPGTVQVSNNFFVDQTEIRNIDWREFTLWILNYEGIDSFNATTPDTTIWNFKQEYQPYIVFYYRHPAYNKYPVVGIFHHMAKEYAKWRTHQVLELMLIQKEKLISLNMNPEKCFSPEKYFSGNWQSADLDFSFRFPVY